MLTQEQRNAINKRLDAISNLSDRTDREVEGLIEEFAEICGLPDALERSQKEQEFQEKLISLENTIFYLTERKKI